MTCQCGHENHAWTEPTVCRNLDCNCTEYREATVQHPIKFGWEKYVRAMDNMEMRLQWILDNLKMTRNYTNNEFIDFFIKTVKTNKDGRTPAYETIRRCRQKLVEANPDRYGPFDPTLIEERKYKQVGIESWVIGK